MAVTLAEKTGVIHADLSVGANVASAVALQANANVSSPGVKVIDAFGLSAEQLRSQRPAVYQWLRERVKPERDQNNRPSRRDNWWLFGETNPKLRKQLATLPRQRHRPHPRAAQPHRRPGRAN